jgi:hypothetical protein
MAKTYEIEVTPKDKSAAGWFVQYFRWVSYDAPNPDLITIENWSEKKGVFTAIVELQPAEYGLVCHAAMAGRQVSVLVKPQPTIVQPSDGKWPLEVKVPADRTQAMRVYYFQVGDGQ